jgi:hypothetical protein
MKKLNNNLSQTYKKRSEPLHRNKSAEALYLLGNIQKGKSKKTSKCSTTGSVESFRAP